MIKRMPFRNPNKKNGTENYMELIVFSFIIHILSLLTTIGISTYVYYYVSMNYLPEFLGHLFLTISLINILNLLPLLIKDVIWLKYKIISDIEERNKSLAEKFLLKFQAETTDKHDNTLFTDAINERQDNPQKEGILLPIEAPEEKI